MSPDHVPPGGPSEEGTPQLFIWDASSRETHLGQLAAGGVEWEVFVLAERAGPDLYRGRISFRHEEDRRDTAPVLVEESEEALVRRAGELPLSMLRQLLASLSAS